MLYLFPRLIGIAISMLLVAACDVPSLLVTTPNEIVIGVMLAPAQGASNSQLSNKAAAALAEKDLNEEFAKQGSPLKVRLIQSELNPNPDITLENIRKLHAQGVNLVVGPSNSADIIAVKAFADKNGMVVMSNASTAPTLALVDNVYRLVPNDILQTKVLANRIIQDGLKKALVIYRKDLYGEDFRRYFKEAMESQQGEIIGELVYDSQTASFKPIIDFLHEQIEFAQPAINPKEVALVTVAFREIVPMVREMIAQDEALFGAFRWYGSDGTAQIADIVENADVASFLAKAQFNATSPTVDNSEKFDQFTARLKNEGIADVSIYAAIAYDSVTLLAKTAADLKTKKLEGIDAWRSNLPLMAEKLEGVTGNLALNAEGDRKALPYGLWGLEKKGSAYAWKFNGVLSE